MLTEWENERLVRTGPGTAMGSLIRRYWIPVCLSEEVLRPDGDPVRVRVLGERLVAFRDSNGVLGLIAERCPHRGTSLFYGRNEECGLRCIYHGWKFDVSGRVVDTPAEPKESRFKDKLQILSYPVHEAGGMVFAYMGPESRRPLFPAYPWTDLPLEYTYVTKSRLDCNWLQGLEGECDSAHLSFLHRQMGPDADKTALYVADQSPEYSIEEMDFGLRLLARRHTSPGEVYFRLSSFVMPVSCWVPARGKEAHMYVAIDDTHTWRFDFGFRTDRPVRPEDVHRRAQIGPDYRRIRRLDNDYLQDREAQRTLDFTGIEDFLNEDACATESMGPILDRREEHLGVSDRAVIAVRRYFLSTLAEMENGADPPHLVYDPQQNRFGHVDTLAEMMPESVPYREWFTHLRPDRRLAPATPLNDAAPQNPLGGLNHE